MELIVAIVSGVIAIASALFSVFTYYNTVLHDRKLATLEAYNRLQAEVFDPLNSYTPMEISDICEDTKSVEYKVLSGYLARIEHFYIGINEKIYDKGVFYKMAHGYFDGHILYRRIEPILMSKKNAEQYYSNTYSVLEQMNKKSTKEI
jgi:hypothetical protein